MENSGGLLGLKMIRKQKNLNQLKVALFGGSDDVTDEMWEEVKRYAKFIYDKEQKS